MAKVMYFIKPEWAEERIWFLLMEDARAIAKRLAMLDKYHITIYEYVAGGPISAIAEYAPAAKEEINNV